MSEFWLISSGLCVVAAIFIFIPGFVLSRKKRAADDVALSSEFEQRDENRERQNVLIFKERLAELEKDYRQGKVDQATFKALKEELEAGLLSDVSPSSGQPANHSSISTSRVSLFSALTLLFVVGFSYGLYFHLGSYDKALQFQSMHFEPDELAQAKAAVDQGDMSGLIQQLYAKLKNTPDNIEGWMLLSRSAMNIENYTMAIEGFGNVARALEQQGQNAAPIYGLLAQAHYFAANGALSADVTAALDKALLLNPNETNAIGLKAIHAFDSGNYKQAIVHWETILEVSPEHAARASLEAGIVRAKSLLGETSIAAGLPQGASDKKPDRTKKARVGVSVALADELANKANPDDIVFIFARAISGPPMPLAASRHRVSELPVKVILDDAMAMAPMAKLSQHEVVNIVARISKTGEPIAKPGDLQGSLESIQVFDGESVSIVIDTQL